MRVYKASPTFGCVKSDRQPDSVPGCKWDLCDHTVFSRQDSLTGQSPLSRASHVTAKCTSLVSRLCFLKHNSAQLIPAHMYCGMQMTYVLTHSSSQFFNRLCALTTHFRPRSRSTWRYRMQKLPHCRAFMPRKTQRCVHLFQRYRIRA